MNVKKSCPLVELSDPKWNYSPIHAIGRPLAFGMVLAADLSEALVRAVANPRILLA